MRSPGLAPATSFDAIFSAGRSPPHPTNAEQPNPKLQFHKPKTYSTVALRCSLSSGVLMSLLLAAMLGPDTIAIYCLPLTSNVIGGAETAHHRRGSGG